MNIGWIDKNATRLFPIGPVALSGPLRESLPSYFSRLAMAHSVMVGDLVKDEIVPRLGVKYYLTQRGIWNFYYKQERYCSSSKISNQVINILEELTGNKHLQQLVFSISESFGKQNIFRNRRAWCPYCLHKWKSEGLVYEPLIWNFSDVEYCKIHNYKLQKICPRCGCEISLFSSKSIPGFCYKCGCWLGDPKHYPEGRLLQNIEWHLWVYDNIAELIAKLPELLQIDVNVSVSSFLEILRELLPIKEISYKTGIPVVSLREWIRTSKRPNFRHLLNLSYCTGFTVKQILLEKSFDIKTDSLKNYVKRFSLNKNIMDHKLLESNLEEILKEDYPPSINEIANRLLVSSSTLQKNFPEQLRMICAKREQVRLMKRNEIQEEIRRAVIQIYSQGKYPSTRAVTKVIARGYLFIHEDNIKVYRDTLHILGLN